MSVLNNLLAKQLEWAKENKNKLAAAEHMEAAAKLLRQEAQATQKPFSFKKEIQAERKSRLEKMGDALKQMDAEKLRTKLHAAGYNPATVGGAFFKNEPGKSHWAKQGQKGILIIHAGKFSVRHADYVIMPETNLNQLDEFLALTK